MEELLIPTQLGDYQLSNRLVVGTHCRLSAKNYCPSAEAQDYYAQLAPSGLIISEPLLVDLPDAADESLGNMMLGLFERSHIESWREINRVIHQNDGKIFAQLWHSENLPCLHALYPELNMRLPPDYGERNKSVLRHEMAINQFRKGAQFAIAADFDGIEIHGALNPLTRRIDASRPSAEYRRAEGIDVDDSALLIELTDVLAAIWDRDRLGVFLSCSPEFSDNADPDPEATLYSIVDSLRYVGVAYIHIGEASQERSILEEPASSVLDIFRSIYDGKIVFNSKELEEAIEVLRESRADLVSLSDAKTIAAKSALFQNL